MRCNYGLLMNATALSALSEYNVPHHHTPDHMHTSTSRGGEQHIMNRVHKRERI